MLPAATHLLADLVRLPSVNPMGRTDIPDALTREHRVTDYLEAKLRTLGVPVVRTPVAPGRDNLVAVYTPPHPYRITLMWEAHQDTVPTDGMTIDPFAAAVAGGRLAGRGACDVKAGIAAMLAAFARLATENPPGACRVVLAFTVDEEHTFLGAQELVKGVTADFAIAAEPTGLNVVIAHKGVARWRVETAGRACHSSRPADGVNAVYKMARLLVAAEAFAEKLAAARPDPLLGTATLSVGRIEGGVSPNTVPDFCRIDVDRRLLPGEKADAAKADFDAFLRAACPQVAFTSPMTLACPALTPCRSPLVARLGAAIDGVTGGRHALHAVPYGTDASTLAEAGIPSVVFGPGDIAQAHTKDEWVDLGQVERAAEILFRFAQTAGS